MSESIHVPITPYDCFERLTDALATSEGRVTGSVSLEEFVLRAPARFGVAASPMLSGAFKPQPDGTDVHFAIIEAGAGWLRLPMLLGAWAMLWVLWLVALLLWLGGGLALWEVTLLGATNVAAGLLLWWWVRRASAPADLATFLEAALAESNVNQVERSRSTTPHRGSV